MNSFMSWIGGKMRLRDIIIACFPLSFERYIEVFGGAGWVLFHKKPTSFEVYNDYNSNLANLYRCVRDRKDELIDALKYTLNSREDFNIITSLFESGAEIGDVDRASKFYQLIRLSYASGCDSFSCQPHNIWSDFPGIDAAHHRLRTNGVIIENKDFEKLIKHYDRPESFFYCDPPYWGTEGHYANSNFDRQAHFRLWETLMQIQGKWLLSYNDCPEIRAMYEITGIYILPVKRLDNIKQRYDGGAEYNELLIANYDLSERERKLPQQLGLF